VILTIHRNGTVLLWLYQEGGILITWHCIGQNYLKHRHLVHIERQHLFMHPVMYPCFTYCGWMHVLCWKIQLLSIFMARCATSLETVTVACSTWHLLLVQSLPSVFDWHCQGWSIPWKLTIKLYLVPNLMMCSFTSTSPPPKITAFGHRENCHYHSPPCTSSSSITIFVKNGWLGRPPLWSSGQSSWLQIQRPGFDSWHYQKKKVVGLERGPLSLVSTTEELLDRKVAAPV
jgi:hypothetical protein